MRINENSYTDRSVSLKKAEISLAENESCCRGPWQNIDFFVKY